MFNRVRGGWTPICNMVYVVFSCGYVTLCSVVDSVLLSSHLQHGFLLYTPASSISMPEFQRMRAGGVLLAWKMKQPNMYQEHGATNMIFRISLSYCNEIDLSLIHRSRPRAGDRAEEHYPHDIPVPNQLKTWEHLSINLFDSCSVG